MTNPTTAARFAALAPRCEFGPSYSRGVAGLLQDARLFESRDDAVAAEHYLLLAEVEGGLIDWDTFEAADPFRRSA